MKHFLILSILAVTVLPLQSIAQKKVTPGFLGKKIVLDFAGVAHPHVVYNLVSEPGFNSNLREQEDWWDFGFKGGIGINVHPNLILGVQFSQLSQSSKGPDYMYLESAQYSVPVDHEMLDYKSNSFAFKVEFTGNEGILPVGFSHGISAGVTINSIVDRTYTYRNAWDNYVLNGKFDQSVDIPKEFNIAYTANMRQPISRNLAINFGLAYSLNFMPGSGGFIYSDYYESIIYDMARNRRFSLMTAHVGLSIIL